MIIEIEQWAKDAACRGKAEYFFDSDDFVEGKMPAGDRQSLDGERRLRAKLICSTCQVREQCLQHALGDGEDYLSVMGGYTASERVLLRRGEILPPFGYPLRRGDYPSKARGWTLVQRFAEGESLAALCDEYGIARGTALQEIRYALTTGEWQMEATAA